MRIAFTAKGATWEDRMDPRFGRTAYLLIFDDVKKTLEHYDNRVAAEEGHGAGPQTAKKLFDLHPDVLITGNGPGGNAAAVLAKAGIKIYTGAGEMDVHEAYEHFQKGNLTLF